MPALILLLLLLLVGLPHKLHCFGVVELVPKTVRTHHDEVMVVHFETSDFGLIDDDAVLGVLGLEVTKGACGGQSAWKDPQWASDGVVETIGHFGDSSSLVNLAARLDDALLLIGVAGFVVLGYLVALVELITGEDGTGIAQVCCIAEVVVNEKNQSAAAAVVTLLAPLTVSFDEGTSQGRGNILAPVEVEEVLVEFILEELGAFGTAMAIIDAEPLGILFQVDGDLVLVALPVEALVSDGSVGLEMRSQASTNGMRQFGDLSRGLLGGLLLLALLAGVVEEWSSEGLGDEVGVDAVLIDAGGGEDFFEAIAGSARLNERLLGRLRLRLDDGDVL